MTRKLLLGFLILTALLLNGATAVANQSISSAVYNCQYCIATWCLDAQGQWQLNSVIWEPLDPSVCNPQ